MLFSEVVTLIVKSLFLPVRIVYLVKMTTCACVLTAVFRAEPTASCHGHPVCCGGPWHHHPGKTCLVRWQLPGGDWTDSSQNTVREQQANVQSWQVRLVKKLFLYCLQTMSSHCFPQVYWMHLSFDSVLTSPLSMDCYNMMQYFKLHIGAASVLFARVQCTNCQTVVYIAGLSI